MASPTRPGEPARRPDAVLFDLDGTLIDSIDLICQSAEFAFAKCGLDCPTTAEWMEGVGRPLPVMFRRFAPADSDVERLILAYREFQMANHDLLLRGYDGVPEMLSTLAERGHALGIVTSKTTALATRGLAQMGLDRFFTTIIGMDSSTRHKPDPEPVLIALDRLGVAARDAWYVGDSVHDMEAGNAAGVGTIGALWGPFTADHLAPSRPTHMVMRAADVPEIVRA